MDKNLAGPDHKASLQPDEFRKMVQSIRNVEQSLGSGVKEPCKSEFKIRKIARKSIVAAMNISKGMIISREMLAIKRPGTGIEPKYLEKLIGKSVGESIQKDCVLTWSFLK
ncbi:MAG: N-acetylneuraminate synthase family protein [bacterium]